MNDLKQTLVDNYKVVSIGGMVLGAVIVGLNVASIVRGMNTVVSVVGIVFGAIAIVFSVFTFIKGVN